MAHYKDVSFQNQNLWLHDLARVELHPDMEAKLQFGGAFDSNQLIEESTIGFLNQIRQHMMEHANVLNGYSDSGSKFSEVKVFQVAQSAADFMVYRNQVKLVFSNITHGIIQITYAHHVRGNMYVNGQSLGDHSTPMGTSSMSAFGNPSSYSALSLRELPPQELLAQVGPFRDVTWTFQNEKVEPEQVAKFYFAEFVRLTRDFKPGKGPNQQLLNQIKALLNDQGVKL